MTAAPVAVPPEMGAEIPAPFCRSGAKNASMW